MGDALVWDDMWCMQWVLELPSKQTKRDVADRHMHFLIFTTYISNQNTSVCIKNMSNIFTDTGC